MCRPDFRSAEVSRAEFLCPAIWKQIAGSILPEIPWEGDKSGQEGQASTLRSQERWGISYRSLSSASCSFSNNSLPLGFRSDRMGLSLKDPRYTRHTCDSRPGQSRMSQLHHACSHKHSMNFCDVAKRVVREQAIDYSGDREDQYCRAGFGHVSVHHVY